MPSGTLRAEELVENVPYPMVIDGVPVAVVKTGGAIYAVHNICSHEYYELAPEGEVVDCRIECPLHGSTFDLRTGEPDSPPAQSRIASFKVELRNGSIVVDVSASMNGVEY